GIVLGLDEAGRGAVLGPLIVAAVAIPAEKEGLLQEVGARDSKTISRRNRRRILRALWAEGARGRVAVIPPERIDEESLTVLELRAMAWLIRRSQPGRVVLDPPVGPRAIPQFLSALSAEAGFPRERLEAFPQADKKSPVVSAASILAKVVRDGYIQVLRRSFGDIGWGYPGEEKVQKFLRHWVEEHQDLPPICRRRWRSVQSFCFPKLQDDI
ncbi:MAG: ribonuclease HII, partial [Candidatus Bipolaricaulaceae bacterium]